MTANILVVILLLHTLLERIVEIHGGFRIIVDADNVSWAH